MNSETGLLDLCWPAWDGLRRCNTDGSNFYLSVEQNRNSMCHCFLLLFSSNFSDKIYDCLIIGLSFFCARARLEAPCYIKNEDCKRYLFCTIPTWWHDISFVLICFQNHILASSMYPWKSNAKQLKVVLARYKCFMSGWLQNLHEFSCRLPGIPSSQRSYGAARGRSTWRARPR